MINPETEQLKTPWFERVGVFSLGCLAVLLLNRDGSPTIVEQLAHRAEAVAVLANPPEQEPTSYSSDAFSEVYTRKLIQDLQHEGASTEARLKAVRSSLRYVELAGRWIGSAFEIDESGIYLTARHMTEVQPTVKQIINQNIAMTVRNPYSGQVAVMNTFLISDTADLAIMYAPTGKNPRATEGLQLSRDLVELDATLHMHTIRPMTAETALSISKAGEVIRADEDRIFVKGLIPFGGSSGSPTVNDRGIVIGIEQGAYGGTLYEDYEGAIVAPLANIDTVFAPIQMKG